ncbi:MAG TPA: PCRF domain-containing protein, partial [Candidatus Limnocylindria bacterium]
MDERLREIEERYEGLTGEMSSPGLDVARMAEIGRELARLEPVVSVTRQWREVQDELRSTAEMARDPDEEVRQLAREEL